MNSYTDGKCKKMMDALPEKTHQEKEYNEYITLGNKAMPNGDGRLVSKNIKMGLKVIRSKKTMGYYLSVVVIQCLD